LVIRLAGALVAEAKDLLVGGACPLGWEVLRLVFVVAAVRKVDTELGDRRLALITLLEVVFVDGKLEVSTSTT